MSFHPNSIEGFERSLKRLREQLADHAKCVERCVKNLAEAQRDHAALVTGIADTEQLLAYMRFTNGQQDTATDESAVA